MNGPSVDDSLAATAHCLQPWRRRALLRPALAVVLALAILPFSQPVAKGTHRVLVFLPLSPFFATSVQMAGLTVAILTGCLIWLLDSRRRIAIIYLVVAVLTAGAVNSVVKEIAGRPRPTKSDSPGDKSEAETNAFNAGDPDARVSG